MKKIVFCWIRVQPARGIRETAEPRRKGQGLEGQGGLVPGSLRPADPLPQGGKGRPGRGRDHRIRIPNVYDLEDNIHAAVKYTALIRDAYFNEPDLQPEARMHLAMAAYNAGPAKIAQARRKTEELGYDKNQWFRNTEYGALVTVGREPVRYVSNINKYYISCVMADEILRLRGEEREHLLSAIP